MTYYAAWDMPAMSSGGSGMGVGSAAMMIGGLVTGALGSYYSAKNQKIQLEGQAKLADINARIADLNARGAERGAQQELFLGEKEVGQISMQAGRLKSAQRVALAANGVDLGQGNAAELQASTDLMKEIDMNTAQANAIRSAWGYRMQAADMQMQGVNQRNDALVKRATSAGIRPGMAAASSLLGSAGQVAGSWYQMNKAGAIK